MFEVATGFADGAAAKGCASSGHRANTKNQGFIMIDYPNVTPATETWLQTKDNLASAASQGNHVSP
jgi:hypothetical protein